MVGVGLHPAAGPLMIISIQHVSNICPLPTNVVVLKRAPSQCVTIISQQAFCEKKPTNLSNRINTGRMSEHDPYPVERLLQILRRFLFDVELLQRASDLRLQTDRLHLTTGT